jgi:hypothetical protein
MNQKNQSRINKLVSTPLLWSVFVARNKQTASALEGYGDTYQPNSMGTAISQMRNGKIVNVLTVAEYTKEVLQ